ncbi:unnamed protein product, partial [Iphiclides podalirius]
MLSLSCEVILKLVKSNTPKVPAVYAYGARRTGTDLVLGKVGALLGTAPPRPGASTDCALRDTRNAKRFPDKVAVLHAPAAL